MGVILKRLKEKFRKEEFVKVHEIFMALSFHIKEGKLNDLLSWRTYRKRSNSVNSFANMQICVVSCTQSSWNGCPGHLEHANANNGTILTIKQHKNPHAATNTSYFALFFWKTVPVCEQLTFSLTSDKTARPHTHTKDDSGCVPLYFINLACNQQVINQFCSQWASILADPFKSTCHYLVSLCGCS